MAASNDEYAGKTALVFFRGAIAMHFKYLENFVNALNDQKIEPYVIFHEASKPPEPVVNRLANYEYFNLSARVSLREHVRGICESRDVIRIFVFHDEDIFNACLCRQDNNIVGMLPENGIHFRDKNVMQARAKELGFKVPESCLPHTQNILEAFAREYGYPVIIKPYNGFGCGNTFKIKNEQQLLDVWKQIRNDRHDYRVEQYIAGRQFFIDSLFQDNQVIFDNLSMYTYNIIDYKESGQHQGVVTLGEGESDAHRKMLLECRQLLSGFGLGTGVAHTEFFLTSEGDIYFGETAARCGGGPIISLLKYAYGFDLVEQWLKLDLGVPHKINKKPKACFGAEYLSCETKGTIKSVTGKDKMSLLPNVVEADVWAAPGDQIKDAEHCYEVLGYYVCRGNDYAEIKDSFVRIRNEFSVTLL